MKMLLKEKLDIMRSNEEGCVFQVSSETSGYL